MPEGDTLFRIATTLRGVLAGQRMTGFASPLCEVEREARRLGLVGQTVRDVEARGKHLLIHFDGGALLHTHLGMPGSWHLYRPGSPWRKSPGAARAVLHTETAVAVCFAAPVVELLPPGSAVRHRILASLGPDLLAADYDGATALANLRARASEPIGVAVMDQQAVAGIGNVYKSEVLFLCRVAPAARVADLDDATLTGILETARQLLSRNVGPGRRRTRPESSREPLWVYGRSGLPCLRCRTPVRILRQGTLGRTTYFCPRCQAASGRRG